MNTVNSLFITLSVMYCIVWCSSVYHQVYVMSILYVTAVVRMDWRAYGGSVLSVSIMTCVLNATSLGNTVWNTSS